MGDRIYLNSKSKQFILVNQYVRRLNTDMKIERTSNARRNIKSGLVLRGLTIVSPFILRLLIVRTLGIEYVGLSGIFSAVLNVLNLAELGIGSAMVYAMYEPIAKDDIKQLGALLKLYRNVYFAIAGIVLIVGGIATFFLPMLVKDECPSDVNMYYLYGIYLFNTLVPYLFGAYRSSLFLAHQRDDVINKTSLFVTLGIYGLQFLVLCFFKNYYIYALLIAVGGVITNVILATKSRKIYPCILVKGELGKEDIRKIVKGIGGLFLNKIMSVIRSSVDTIVLTAYSGMVASGTYSNYFYVLIALNGLLLVFPQSIRAGIGNSLVLQNEDKNYSDFVSFQFAYMFLSGLVIICFASFCQPFILTCFGRKLLLENKIVILLSAYLFSMKIVDLTNVFSDASGLWWKNKWATIIDAIFNLVMDIVLGKYFGLFGIVLATIFSIYLFQFWMKTYICFKEVFSNRSMLEYCAIQHIIGAVITVAIIVGKTTTWIAKISNIYAEATISALLSCISFCLLFFILFRKNRYFNRAADILERTIKR